MRVLPILLLACNASRNTGPGPSNPGVGNVDATVYGGDPFVPGADDLVVVESESGTRFNLAGQAFDGPLAEGKVQLAPLPAMTAFWFAWSVHWPGARVWNGEPANEGAAILGDETCGVPCDEIVSGCFGGKDCIPSIDDPDWTTPDDDRQLGYLADTDRVLGIAREDLARAYPLDTLWTHEIVNDTWGDWTFSVTYCPLTGSGIGVDGRQGGRSMRFGVSGNLYNSNLVMYDRRTESLYGQMRQVGIQGENLGLALATVGVMDTTWGTWRAMYPHTEVLTEKHASSYPYGDYRTDDADTFMATNPPPDPRYPGKSLAIGVTAFGETSIYAFDEIERTSGARAAIEDVVGELPVLVLYDGRDETAVIYSRLVDGVEHHFELE